MDSARSSNTTPLAPLAFRSPAILLSGQVNDDMYRDFRRQFDRAVEQAVVVVELSTLGGDPEVARMMGEDIRFHSEITPDRRFVFLGKAAIYSAGTTFMSFFARCNRYLTRGTRLMIHERKLSKELKIQRAVDHLRRHRHGDPSRDRGIYRHSERRFRQPDRRIERINGRGAQKGTV